MLIVSIEDIGWGMGSQGPPGNGCLLPGESYGGSVGENLDNLFTAEQARAYRKAVFELAADHGISIELVADLAELFLYPIEGLAGIGAFEHLFGAAV